VDGPGGAFRRRGLPDVEGTPLAECRAVAGAAPPDVDRVGSLHGWSGRSGIGSVGRPGGEERARRRGRSWIERGRFRPPILVHRRNRPGRTAGADGRACVAVGRGRRAEPGTAARRRARLNRPGGARPGVGDELARRQLPPRAHCGDVARIRGGGQGGERRRRSRHRRGSADGRRFLRTADQEQRDEAEGAHGHSILLDARGRGHIHRGHRPRLEQRSLATYPRPLQVRPRRAPCAL
jgi:hypothetical protein